MLIKICAIIMLLAILAFMSIPFMMIDDFPSIGHKMIMGMFALMGIVIFIISVDVTIHIFHDC